MVCSFRTLILCISILLLGCKAEEIELRLSTKEIAQVIKNNPQEVRFQAEFSLLAEYDEEVKRTIKRVQEISEKYIEIEEFDVTQGNFGLKIEVEGLIPFVGPKSTATTSPWILKIQQNSEQGVLGKFSHKLIFGPSSTLDSYLAEVQAVNLMLSPARYQPVKFKIRNKSGHTLKILTGGVEIEGESKALLETSVGDRISLSMNGGIYDKTSAVIYINME